jgi:hypothetical protein
MGSVEPLNGPIRRHSRGLVTQWPAEPRPGNAFFPQGERGDVMSGGGGGLRALS